MSSRPIVIAPYNPQWPDEFRAIAGPLRQALGHLATRIDHIGSTSVPDLAAKDIIDIQVSVRSLEPRDPLVAALATVDYTPFEGIAIDHEPPGMGGNAHYNWAKLYFRPPSGQRPTHLHVRVDGRANARYALLFRDYLRCHPLARDSYAEIKRQLARHFVDDWDAFYDVKDPVCDAIMAGAYEWAGKLEWEPAPSDA